MTGPRVIFASANDLADALDDLTEILHLSVHAGASVGFVLPFSPSEARQFWTDTVFPAVAAGRSLLFLARQGPRVCGTVQLGVSLPANQAHRADVAKLLVHPDMRRRGTARALMQRLEHDAINLGKQLLVLDTRSGDPAQRLYHSLGFEVAGTIPGFCRNPTEDRLESTTYLFKALP